MVATIANASGPVSGVAATPGAARTGWVPRTDWLRTAAPGSRCAAARASSPAARSMRSRARVVGGRRPAPVLGGGVHRGRHRGRAEVREQRTHARGPAPASAGPCRRSRRRSTGLPASASCSITSKNSLNSPLYDALKIGVTAISAVGRRHRVERGLQGRAREAGQQVVRRGPRAWSRSSITSTPDARRPARRARRRVGGGQAVGQQPGRRRLAEARASRRRSSGRSSRHAVARLGRARPSLRRGSRRARRRRAAPRRRRRGACVGASGTSAGRRSRTPCRSTGTTSSPSMSSCSSTVFSGSPAWSIRNSWRW